MSRFVIEDDPAGAGFDISDDAPQESVGKRSGRQLPGEMQGFISAFQGPTLGFLDELTGGVQGAGAFIGSGGDMGAASKAYRENRDLIRGAEAEYRDKYPLAGLTKTAAAMPVYMAAPVAKLASLPVNLGTNILRALPSALAIGGLTAAGESEAETPMGVAKDAATGAAVSGAATAVTLPIAAGIGGAYRGVQRVAGGSSPAGSAARAEIERKAREELAKNITRDAKPGTVFSGAPVPTGEVNAAGQPIMRSPVSSATEQAAKQVGKLGERGMILDLPGGNVRQLADTLTILPGQTKNKVVAEQLARRATSADRLINSADEAIASLNAAGRRAVREGRVPPTPAVNPSIEAFKASRRAAAAPLYRQLEAMEVTVDAPTAAALKAMRELGALKSAKRMATADRRVFTLDGDIPVGARVSAADLDLAKRGLDQLIHKQTDQVTGAVSPEGTRLLGLLDDFKNYFDDLTIDPATGQSVSKAARSAWAGDTALIQATELGRRALDADKGGKIASEIAKLGDSEVQAFRIGVLDAIKQKAGSKTGRTQLLSFWENPNVSDKLKAAFGGNFKQFASALMREERLKGIQKIGQGSQSVTRLGAVDDLGQAIEDVASVASTVKTGSPLGFMGALKTLYQKTAMPEPVRDELGRIMTLKGPEAQRELMSLADLVREMQAKRMISAGRIGAATGAAGRAVPGSNNQQQ